MKERTVVGSARCRKAGCPRSGDHSRGLCEPCYKATQQYVKDGVIEGGWATLEKQGKVDRPKSTLKDWLLS